MNRSIAKWCTDVENKDEGKKEKGKTRCVQWLIVLKVIRERERGKDSMRKEVVS